MRWVLEPLARAAERRPVLLLVALAVITVVLGGFATDQDTATDITEFAPESEAADGQDRIADEFGAAGGESSAQVIADAGTGGNVLDRDGLIAAERIRDTIEAHPDVEDALADDGAVVTWAEPILGQADALDLDAEDLTEVFADALVEAATDGDGADQLEGLLSEDFDADEARAQGGLVIVTFDDDVDGDDRSDATFAMAQALSDLDLGATTVDVFSFDVLTEDIDEGFEVELPLLMGISLLLMLVILSVLYRKISDVIVGVVGLVITIVWMTGIAVLLGPGYLGVAGEFNQIAIAVPVLLVGLGIDYSVHLVTRYRENRLTGSEPSAAASLAIRTVGVALVLATITTLIGFLSNLVAPLPPIADFGMFAGAGVLSAFVVLTALVPATRVLLDRRRPDRLPDRVAESQATAQATAGIGRLARRAPIPLLVGAVLVAGVGGVAASDLDSEFSQDEFIPEGSSAASILDRLDEVFGGDVSEETDLLIDADFGELEAWQALLAFEEAVADVDDVVTEGDRPDVQSPTAELFQITDQSEQIAEALQGEIALAIGEADDDAFLPLPDRLSLSDLPDPLTEDAEEDGLDPDDLGDELGEGDEADVDPGEAFDLDALAARLPDDVDAEEALVDRLLASELASALREGPGEAGEGLDDLDESAASDLVDADPATVTLDDLEAIGYPTDDLDDSARDALTEAEELREAGFADGTLADDADLDAILATLDAEDGLDGVLRDDLQAAVARLATRGGEDGADALAAAITAELGPLEDVATDTLIVSEPLIIDETLQALNDAQTQAIVISLAAALVLMVSYYGVTMRRPLLGVITMLPALLSVPLVLGTMWVLGLPLNAMTATIASIAIGIGVPYGIHLTNRFREETATGGDPDEAIVVTLDNTGAGLLGSAVTTGGAFAVLMLSEFPPIAQFGGITAITIAYALLAAAFVESAGLVLWGRYHARRDQPARAPQPQAAPAPTPEPAPAPAAAQASQPAREPAPEPRPAREPAPQPTPAPVGERHTTPARAAESSTSAPQAPEPARADEAAAPRRAERKRARDLAPVVPPPPAPVAPLRRAAANGNGHSNGQTNGHANGQANGNGHRESAFPRRTGETGRRRPGREPLAPRNPRGGKP